MTILVTAATGHLGRLAVLALLERGVPASDLVAAARDTSRLADLAERGVETRRADYDDPASLRDALAGVDRLLFVSGSAVGQRSAQHRAVVEAAVAAGVGHVVYTSAPHADSASYALAEEHRETEERLAASGLAVTVLRNGWYVENYTENAGPALATGHVYGAAGDGRVSAATRADLAEAAAVVLTEDGHGGRTYELGGEAFTLAEWAAVLGEATGREITYVDLPADAYAAALAENGVPEQMAQVLADSDAGLARGELLIETGDLARLLGRTPTTTREALAANPV